MRERKRCRMHGGARGSGARFGNRNALKHGNYSRAERLRLRAVRALIRESEAMLTAAGEPRPAARKDGG